MDTRIKDKTKIFGNGEITQAEQNYTGCFGYFANKAEDFNNLENTFYGQFIGTDYSDRRFYTPDPETGNALKFLMFLPEEFVSDDLVEVPESDNPEYPDYLEEPPEEIDIPEYPETQETQDWDYDDYEPVVSENTETQNRIDHIFDKINNINDRLGLFDYFHFDVEFSALKERVQDLENRITKLEKLEKTEKGE